MNKNIILALFTVATLGFCPSVQAQSNASVLSNQHRPDTPQPLEDRLQRCMGEAKCPVQLRLQLMDEMYGKMGQLMQEISQGCVKTGYGGCVDPQKAEVQEWHRLNKNMQDMMLSMEGASSDQIAHVESETNR